LKPAAELCTYRPFYGCGIPYRSSGIPSMWRVSSLFAGGGAFGGAGGGMSAK